MIFITQDKGAFKETRSRSSLPVPSILLVNLVIKNAVQMILTLQCPNQRYLLLLSKCEVTPLHHKSIYSKGVFPELVGCIDSLSIISEYPLVLLLLLPIAG